MASAAAAPLPRIVLYHQTINDSEGKLNSILPLITQPDISVTHIIAAAIHVNEDPNALTLNDHHPSHARYTSFWAEMRMAQASGIKVMGMLGGAAKGSFQRLDKGRYPKNQDEKNQTMFERYYSPVAELIRSRALDGLDLDVEEEMTLEGIIYLIDRLRSDFGPSFIITLAPVATALLDERRNLSGFSYEALEVMRGNQIAWYNTQFYCGWGDASSPVMYEFCVARGWRPDKIVMGLVTTPENGPGFVPFEILSITLGLLRRQFSSFGGVMGWEYFNGLPGGKKKPWEWAQKMTRLLRSPQHFPFPVPGPPANPTTSTTADVNEDAGGQTEVPQAFDYHTDGEDS
ncbi:glycoside hydrolase family 18 protein [Xylariomycetidae sp. FL0641]|nr:glycoside hydrolase family 18 protein [Xylariomycetidae sp. FL0641]